MDSTNLVSSIQAEVDRHKGDSLTLLCLQNHLYGCFIVMEDLAQSILDWKDGHLEGNSLRLHADRQFDQIGIRYYGFVMDGKAVYTSYSDDYKKAWLALFQEMKQARNMEAVDQLEDRVIQELQVIPKDGAFFMNALEHDGNLSPDWVEKALGLLHPHLMEEKEAEELKPSVLSSAISDRPVSVPKSSKTMRKLAITRRQRSHSSVKPSLSTTRRSAIKR
jgi:hypothetical protein